jgi:hypothetical protein
MSQLKSMDWKFAYLVVENYISPDSMFPPPMWSAQPSAEAKRTTNGAESFHAHFNEQINSGPLLILVTVHSDYL